VSLRNKVLIAIVFVAALAIVIRINPALNFKRQLFQFGVKRGFEDQRTGAQYATDGAYWRMVHHQQWTADEKQLMLHLMRSDPAGNLSGEADVFMAGYNLSKDWFKYLFGIVTVTMFWNRNRWRPHHDGHSEPESTAEAPAPKNDSANS
jgi:hypothetical protein